MHVLRTPPGDANLDGQFDSSDLVLVFMAGEYEDAVAGNSSWASGDWNCDGEFSTADLIVALRNSDYVFSAVSLAAAAESVEDRSSMPDPALTSMADALTDALLSDASLPIVHRIHNHTRSLAIW